MNPPITTKLTCVNLEQRHWDRTGFPTLRSRIWSGQVQWDGHFRTRRSPSYIVGLPEWTKQILYLSFHRETLDNAGIYGAVRVAQESYHRDANIYC